jgi:hypothetical protein
VTLDEEFLGKLRRIADGALKRIAEREAEQTRSEASVAGPPPPHEFWDGYRQAVEDMTEELRRRTVTSNWR